MRNFGSIFLAGVVIWNHGAIAQISPLPQQEIKWPLASGPVSADGQARHQVVYWTDVRIPGAQWLQLRFADLQLAGIPEEGSASYLRIISHHDPELVQLLNSESAQHWNWTTAQIRGDAVRLELIAQPGSGSSHVSIESVIYGLGAGAVDGLCGGTDDRILSHDMRVARITAGAGICTAWLTNDTNRMFMSAGHCPVGVGSIAHFNTPLSTALGIPQPAHPNEQYPVDAASIQRQIGGHSLGNDWMYLAYHRNSNTGRTAAQAYGVYFDHLPGFTPLMWDMIRSTGYGTVQSPVSLTWNYAQKTGLGPLMSQTPTVIQYRTDNSPSDSGSPLVHEPTGIVVGIMTHGGCDLPVGSNHGTFIDHPDLLAALASPLSLCASGFGAVTPPIFAVGDLVNNFGTVSRGSGEFARINDAPPWMQGLAFDADAGLFYGINYDMFNDVQQLFHLDRMGAVQTSVFLSGTQLVINGLGYDPFSGTLYGISQSNGQLHAIDPATGVASAIGLPGGGRIASLEYSPLDRSLYGINNGSPVHGPELIRIDPATGAQQIIGSITPELVDFFGLAVDERGNLITISGTSSVHGDYRTWRIHPRTGAGAVIGPSGALYPQGFGMAGELVAFERVPAHHPTIQAAIIAASPTQPTIVIVEPGSYNESIDFLGKPVAVMSAGGAAVTTITNANQPLATVRFVSGESSQARLDGFTVIGGLGQLITLPNGISEQMASGVLISSSHPTIRNCIIRDSHVAGFGGGAALIDSSAVIESTAFESNSAGSGGGIAIWGGHPALRSCTFEYNLASGAGGALYVENSNLNMEDMRFSRNIAIAGQGGAIHSQLSPGSVAPIIGTSGFCANFPGHIHGPWNDNTGNTFSTRCERCYANCDESTTQPVLNVDDFVCFINEFAHALQLPQALQIVSYANCDWSSTPPVLNVDDFTCFINEFVAGCP